MPTANRLIIFDTSIFIDHLRANKYTNAILNISGLVRNSSVGPVGTGKGSYKRRRVEFCKNTCGESSDFYTNRKELVRLRGYIIKDL